MVAYPYRALSAPSILAILALIGCGADPVSSGLGGDGEGDGEKCRGARCVSPGEPLNPYFEDRDFDGVIDGEDNCPDDPNADQVDIDRDLVGDRCDNCAAIANADQDPDTCQGPVYDPGRDSDTDTIPDLEDNCPKEKNTDQADGDEDGVGDVCDNCPEEKNPGQTDLDPADGRGDLCQYDALVTKCYERAIEPEIDTVKPNIYFLLDSSGSMANQLDPLRPRPWPIDEARAALSSAAVALENKAQFGLGTFPWPRSAPRADVHTPGLPGGDHCAFTHMLDTGANNRATMQAALDQIEPYGNTPTGWALKKVRERNLAAIATDPMGLNRPRAVVLITDGEPSQVCEPGYNANVRADAYPQARREAAALRAAGVPLYVVGFKFDSDAMLLNELADRGGTDAMQPNGDRFFTADDTAQLVTAIAAIQRQTVSCAFRASNIPQNASTIQVSLAGAPLSEGPDGFSLDPGVGVLTLNGQACDQLRASPDPAMLEISVVAHCTERPDQPIDDDPSTCTPTEEVCDFVDNDCDGIIDEGCEICTPEVCDGVDNDCDQIVDENCPICTAQGEACSADAECCVGSCQDGACAPLCRPSGVACQTSEDCCEGNACANGVCIAG